MILIKRLQRYQRSKLEFKKNIYQLGRPQALGFEPGWSADIFFELQLWPLISLQPLDQNQYLVHHLKDLFHICLETKAQGFWMTFKANFFSEATFSKEWIWTFLPTSLTFSKNVFVEADTLLKNWSIAKNRNKFYPSPF